MKRNFIEIIESKKNKIDKTFTQIEPYLKKEKDLTSLKKNSSLLKICLAVKRYKEGHYYEACIVIYEIFSIKPYNKYKPLTSLVKEKLHNIKLPETKVLEQGLLFKAS